MKKKTVIALTAGIAGMVMMAAAAGAASSIERIAGWPEIVLGPDNYMFHFKDSDLPPIEQPEKTDEIPETAKDFTDSDFSLNRYPLPEDCTVSEIQIISDQADLVVQPGDAWEIETKNLPAPGTSLKGYSFDWSVKDEVLTVRSSNPDHLFGMKTIEIVVTVPKSLLELDLSVQAGNIHVGNLACRQAEIETQLGDIELSSLDGTGRWNVHTSLGNVECSDLIVREASLSSSLGDIQVKKTKFEQTMNLDTSAGNIQAQFSMNLSDVFSVFQTDLGEVTFQGERLDENSRSIGPRNASRKLTIHTNVGNIDVQ